MPSAAPTYTSPNFIFSQKLDLGEPLHGGDEFGVSVSISVDTLVVGGYGTDKPLNRKSNPGYEGRNDGSGGSSSSTEPSRGRQVIKKDVGAAYVFRRSYHVEDRPYDSREFVLEQELGASDAHEWDRYGRSVSIHDNTIVVTAHEEYVGPIHPRKAVQTVTTTAQEGQLSGYWRALWRQFKDENVWEYLPTRPIAHDATSDDVKEILEIDFDLEEVLVVRSAADERGGFTWTVTFVSSDSVPEMEAAADDDNPLTVVDADGIVMAESADVYARVIHGVMQQLRSNTYLYTRDPYVVGSHWTEQVSLTPKKKQESELFGMAAAVHFQTALVGCPNRDTFVSEINAGAGFFFDLGFLNVGFAKQHYSIEEGGMLGVTVLRCRGEGLCHTQQNDSRLEVIMNYDTGDVVSTDRVNQLALTKLMNTGYGGVNQRTVATGMGWWYDNVQKWLDPRQVSTAIERGQTYGAFDLTGLNGYSDLGEGEHRSLWIDTQFDHVGLSDYAPESGELIFTPFQGTKQFEFYTTNDHLVEFPDEVAMVRLSLPGIWPSYGGQFWSTVTIMDDGDGLAGTQLRLYHQKLYMADDVELQAARWNSKRTTSTKPADDFTPPNSWPDNREPVPTEVPTDRWPEKFVQKSGYGFASSVDDTRGVSAVGAPFKFNGTRPQVGAVYVYRKRIATKMIGWDLEERLVPNERLRPYAHFGKSVVVDGALLNRGDGTSYDNVPNNCPQCAMATRKVRVIVGAPGHAAAFVFVATKHSSGVGYNWTQEVKLTAPGIHKPEDLFADTNAVALWGDYAVVGAPGVEEAYFFQRNLTGWTQGLRLRSSDYDYDTILGVDYLHRPHFGASVDVSWRTVIVGAPNGDYGNEGRPGTETYHTEGTDPAYFGRGKVYVFHKNPQAQTIHLRNHRTSDELSLGEFKISLTRGSENATSQRINFQASDITMNSQLEMISTIDMVTVTRTGDAVAGYVWSVTFATEVEDIPLMEVTWNGFGCDECAPLSSIYPDEFGGAGFQMEVKQLALQEHDMAEKWSIQAPDRNPGDQFGSVVAIDGHQIAVGAFGSAALTTTTWDFETGDLVGWRKSGTAFDFQPTYGDNTIRRSVYDGVEADPPHSELSYGAGQGSRLENRYFIGTFERHPGSAHNYSLRHDQFNNANYPPGVGSSYKAKGYLDPTYTGQPTDLALENAESPDINNPTPLDGPFGLGSKDIPTRQAGEPFQAEGRTMGNAEDYPEMKRQTTAGDLPQGTLTSQPFVINGTEIQFKIGGGCNMGGEYWNPLVSS
jgi:hypothetical protein